MSEVTLGSAIRGPAASGLVTSVLMARAVAKRTGDDQLVSLAADIFQDEKCPTCTEPHRWSRRAFASPRPWLTVKPDGTIVHGQCGGVISLDLLT